MNDVFHNEFFIMFAMAVIVFALTQALKLPIKFFTKKIQDDVVRKRVNATILLIPFLVGIAVEFLYSGFITFQEFSVVNGLGYGFSGISLYSIVERFFCVKNPYKTDDGVEVLTTMAAICADQKLDENDANAVKEFWDKIK
jgi:hypothetical protein